MLFDQVVVIAGLTVLIMISPGPDMIIVMRNTILDGKRAGLATSLGVLAGNLVHIAYCAVGIGWLISQSILAFSILKYAGAAYLVYLGIMSLRGAGRGVSLEAGNNGGMARARRAHVVQGFLNNILNPKGTLFYLGLFTVVITPQTSAGGVLLLVATTISISALFWVFFVATLDAPLVRRVIENGQGLVNRIFGGVLILLGLRVATLER
ncbi:LysE family translocator [Stappia sp. MMSF_3263]|uniref:LysE family translocator n=1 Tax=Stappia sp. MMSF_3263 TaxID=3046693 RepID=UPI00273E57E5|nr:LysE family translocator [Stappia sp. MMSF_3263]